MSQGSAAAMISAANTIAFFRSLYEAQFTQEIFEGNFGYRCRIGRFPAHYRMGQ
jgi:hypothetical protein